MGGNDAGCDAARQKDMNHSSNGAIQAVSIISIRRPLTELDQDVSSRSGFMLKPAKYGTEDARLNRNKYASQLSALHCGALR